MGLPSCTPCKAEVEIEPPRLEREGSADVPGDSEARVDTSGKELQIDSGTSREHHASDASIHGDKPKPAADLTEKALRSEADVSGNKDLEPKDDVPKLFRQGSNVAVAARGPGLLRHSSSTLELPEEKWWFDNDDPLYFVVTPGSITLGRPCDTDDQVSSLHSPPLVYLGDWQLSKLKSAQNCGRGSRFEAAKGEVMV
jgi:hypothetical protein